MQIELFLFVVCCIGIAASVALTVASQINGGDDDAW